MTTNILNIKDTSVSTTDLAEEKVGNAEIKAARPEIPANVGKGSTPWGNYSLYTLHNDLQVLADANFSALGKRPELIAPDDFFVDLVQILREIQVDFCSADISQAGANGYQIQAGLEEQNRIRNKQEATLSLQKKEFSEKAKSSKERGEALSIATFIFSLAGLLCATGPIGAIIAVVGIALALWALIANAIPEESRADRKNIFGETVKCDYSLSGVIGVLCELTLAMPDTGIGVEGAHTDNTRKIKILSRSEFEDYKLGWSLGMNIALALPGIVYGGIQVWKAIQVARNALTAVSQVANPLAEAILGARGAVVLGRIANVSQVLTSVTAITLAIANAYLAGDRKVIANLEIVREEIQKAITQLQTQFELNHQSFQNSLDFQETLRKAVAVAIANHIEQSFRISKNCA